MTGDMLIVLAASFIGGFLDASVGGGGLVLVPAMFAVFPATPHSVILGTNKLAASVGMSGAVARYMRSVRIPWAVALPCAATYFVMAMAGASVARLVPSSTFRLLVPAMLAIMLVYVLTRRDFGMRQCARQCIVWSRLFWNAAVD